jgi:hypothetical protein
MALVYLLWSRKMKKKKKTEWNTQGEKTYDGSLENSVLRPALVIMVGIDVALLS